VALCWRAASSPQRPMTRCASGQVLRSVAGVDRRSIFAEGDIAHVVDRFDAPMAAAQALQLRRVHLRVGALLKTISASWVT